MHAGCEPSSLTGRQARVKLEFRCSWWDVPGFGFAGRRILVGLILGVIAFAPNDGQAQDRNSGNLPPTLKDRPRLQRLEILADAWGKLFLFHPSVVTQPIDWGGVLERAIPAMERASGSDAIVESLNRDLIANLGDPLTFAFGKRKPSPPGAVSPITARLLSPGIGYVALTDPRALADAAMFSALSRQIEALGSLQRLVVDARWIGGRAPEWSAEWLRLWVDTTLLMGSRVSRQHKGWDEVGPVTCCPNVYEHGWLSESRLLLEPIRRPGRVISRIFGSTNFSALPIVRTPTLVLVNRTSYLVLERELDALQHAGRIAVAFERQGDPIDDGANVLEYGDSIRVHINAAPVLTRSGELGGRPEYMSEMSLTMDELPELALKLLPTSPRTRTATFAFPPFSMPAMPADSTLTREQRLHGLFKVWIVVDHLYPHKRGITGDWSTVLEEFIPHVERAQNIREYTRALLMVATRLNDSHANVSFPGLPLRPPWTIPAWLDFIEGKLVVVWPIPGESSQSNPLQAGDEILSVDGQKPEDIIASFRDIVSVSQPGAYLFTLATAGLLGTRGEQGSTASIRLRRKAATHDVVMRRTQRTPLLVAVQARQPLAMRLDGNLGYVNLGRVESPQVLDSLFREFRNADGLVLDNRFGRGIGEYHAFISHLGDEITDQWQIPTADMFHGRLRHGSVAQRGGSAAPEGERYRKPIVVLTAPTQSAGERLPQWVRDTKRGLTVGSATAGAQGNISSVYLPGGGQFTFSAMRIINPDGSDYQRAGTSPDVPVKLTLRGVMSGRDEVMERGIQVLRNVVTGRLSPPR